MSAARLPCPANARAMRSGPVKNLCEILVTAPGQADEVEIALGLLEQPGDGVRGLERRDDALGRRQLAEGRDRLLVGDRHIARASAVAQHRVLGPRARVVEAGR